jgi:osmotically-inducible protein OsmY
MRKVRSLVGRLVWGSVGAVLFYLFDPERGRSRRTRLAGQASGVVRRAGRAGSRKARYVCSSWLGQRRRQALGGGAPADDRALVDRLKSEVLPRHEAADVVVDATAGVVTLRGQLPSDARIQALVADVRSVPGVREVVNLIHAPGTDAPNKESSLRVS